MIQTTDPHPFAEELCPVCQARLEELIAGMEKFLQDPDAIKVARLRARAELAAKPAPPLN
jgi:hypothetical protein